MSTDLCPTHNLAIAPDGKCVLCRRPPTSALTLHREDETVVSKVFTWILLAGLLGTFGGLVFIARTPAGYQRGRYVGNADIPADGAPKGNAAAKQDATKQDATKQDATKQDATKQDATKQDATPETQAGVAAAEGERALANDGASAAGSGKKAAGKALADGSGARTPGADDAQAQNAGAGKGAQDAEQANGSADKRVDGAKAEPAAEPAKGARAKPFVPKIPPEALAAARKQVEVKMYFAPWCYIICDRARDFLKARDVILVEHDIDQDPEALSALKAINPAATVPTFQIQDETLVGFDAWDLEDAVNAAAVAHYASR